MKKRKIVLIEDDEVLSKIISEELSDAGFQVTKALTGTRGLELVRSSAPSLVLLDLLLPEMQGVDILNALRRDRLTKDIPVIVLTNYDDRYHRKTCFELGICAYLVKGKTGLVNLVNKIVKFFE